MSDILTHTEAGVMTITFNRVDKKNSITAAMYAPAGRCAAPPPADAAVRVVVFQGDATVFSAGNDIGDFPEQAARQRRLAGVPLSCAALPAFPSR
jgi:enoyl-CoA hydratase/carnithine racemase